MLQGWVAIVVALAYIGLLFLVASYGDRSQRLREGRPRMLIYPLSLAIYCTSWTFFGSVGLASQTGIDFLTIYIGPAVMLGLCTPLMLRVIRLAKAQNITKPMFVIQGYNDPRVPHTESEQMVAIARKNQTPVWYLMAKDEGHGFQKKKNRDFQFYASVLFMQQYLLN